MDHYAFGRGRRDSLPDCISEDWYPHERPLDYDGNYFAPSIYEPQSPVYARSEVPVPAWVPFEQACSTRRDANLRNAASAGWATPSAFEVKLTQAINSAPLPEISQTGTALLGSISSSSMAISVEQTMYSSHREITVHGHESPNPASTGSAAPSAADKDRLTLIDDSTGSAPLGAKFAYSWDSRIYLSLLGEVLEYDLKTLGSDPRIIIELLKATQSERANYMIAGAHYRRSGHPHCAKAVMEALLEAFKARGVPDAELKPAYLLLSGCETDLAELAKSQNKEASCISAHYNSSKIWLQKVFGKADPQRNDDDEDKENKPPNANDRNDAPGAKPTSPDKVLSTKNQEADTTARELQSLWNRSAAQARQLSQMRSAKRKLEDDYFQERSLRRKYQSRIEALQEEGDVARKMEKYALDQMRREVALRKK